MGLRDTDFFGHESYESPDTQIIICKQCSSHLCLSSLILSDEFTGSSGPAYLVDNLINFTPDEAIQETKMHTGDYLIKTVFCNQCDIRLGWTYKKSFSFSQAYKEGKFVIEKKFIKFISNNSATSDLILQAKQNNRRRRSSATLSSSSSSINDNDHHSLTNDEFKFNNLPLDPFNKSVSLNYGISKNNTVNRLSTLPRNSLNFRDLYTSSRLRFQGLNKEEFEEGDEDDKVFVDV